MYIFLSPASDNDNYDDNYECLCLPFSGPLQTINLIDFDFDFD